MDQIKIGAFIKSMRKERNLSQQDVADALLVTQKTVSRWENGEGLPDMVIIKDVASFFNVTVDELLNGEKNIIIENEFNKEEFKYLKSNEQNIYNSLNIFTIISLSIFGLFLLVGIILFAVSDMIVGTIISLIGGILSFIIYFINYKNNKNKLNDLDIDSSNFNLINKLIRQKNILFADIFVVLFIITLFLIFACYGFFYNSINSVMNYNNSSTALISNFILIPTSIIFSYYYFRKYIKYGKLENNDKKKLFNSFYIFIIINCIFSLDQVQVINNIINNRDNTINGNTIVEVVRISNYIPSIFLIFVSGATTYIFRSIGVCLALISIISMIVFYIKNKSLLTFISSLLAFVSIVICNFDHLFFSELNYSTHSYFDVLSIIMLIVALLLQIIQFINYLKNKKKESLVNE